MSAPTPVEGEVLLMHFSVSRVLISYLISFMGAYMCTCACEQLRVSFIAGRASLVHDTKWFALMGISLGGIGIWCMHFLGMSAMTLEEPLTGAAIDSSFNIAVSVTSLIVVMITTTAGLMIGANDPMFMKTKREIIEQFIQDASKLSMSEVRKMSNFRLLKLISTKDLRYLVAGGCVSGAGALIMHVIGMNAMRVQGRIEWSPGLVFFSVVIAIVASTAAFWILFRLLSLFPIKEYLRLTSSLIMGIAVCGMHYTGMAAATFKYELHVPKMVASAYMQREDAFVPVTLTVIFLVIIMMVVLLADLRHIIFKYQQHSTGVGAPLWKLSERSSNSRVDTSAVSKSVAPEPSSKTGSSVVPFDLASDSPSPV